MGTSGDQWGLVWGLVEKMGHTTDQGGGAKIRATHDMENRQFTPCLRGIKASFVAV